MAASWKPPYINKHIYIAPTQLIPQSASPSAAHEKRVKIVNPSPLRGYKIMGCHHLRLRTSKETSLDITWSSGAGEVCAHSSPPRRPGLQRTKKLEKHRALEAGVEDECGGLEQRMLMMTRLIVKKYRYNPPCLN